MRAIELLSPAKDLACGIEAVRHGADAVYIGAPQFSARQAAGNSLADIAALVAFAHIYNVKVYVALNTLLHPTELACATEMITQFYRMGVDAVIVQDRQLLQAPLPPIPLHASTQMDNREVAHVEQLAAAGITQVVLPREFTLSQIAAMHQAVPRVAIEVFIHGALCVSYSGQCYMSEVCTGRSANRGACAQLCRLPYDMVDAQGHVIARQQHLLSLKDLNQSDRLEQLLAAGVSSLKIEGRLKDVSYVKNVTAFYRQELDKLFAQHQGLYCRTSSGSSTFTFTPDLNKSFNRSFTHYMIDGRKEEIAALATPKWQGEEMGVVKELRGNSFNVSGVKPFHNGDGVTFFDKQGVLQGFRVNKVEGNRIFLHEKINIAPRTKLFRNYDQQFEATLAKPSATRKIAIAATLGETAWGFTLALCDEDGNTVTLAFSADKVAAHNSQQDNLHTQLSKLGDSPFRLDKLQIHWSKAWFIPSSVLSTWRKTAVARLLQLRNVVYSRPLQSINRHVSTPIPPREDALMRCKHCLRYTMGWCAKHHKKRSPYTEPFFLVNSNGQRFALKFNCQRCEMGVYLAD